MFSLSYSTSHVCQLYSVSGETVRQWTLEFSEYLSPTARPGRHRNRRYSVEDLGILSLVAELKKQGLTFAEIHAALKAGERGKLPTLEPYELQLVTASAAESRSILEIEQLHQKLVKLQEELSLAQTQAAEARELKDENIQLKTSLAHTERQLEETQKRLDTATAELQRRIEELSKQAGEAYAKGYIEALERGERKRGE